MKWAALLGKLPQNCTCLSLLVRPALRGTMGG
jgi:hypothetical protein